MSRAFIKEQDSPDLENDPANDPIDSQPSSVPNYISPKGHIALKNELEQLLNVERPALVKTVAWAASNGDRSENADYIYGKRRLRQIDGRIHFLTRRLQSAQMIDRSCMPPTDRVLFGAYVTYQPLDETKTLQIVGVDEAAPEEGRVSWRSPVAMALLRATVGDVVTCTTPNGSEEISILSVDYR